MLVGRDAEVLRLTSMVDACRTSGAQVALVEGVPGIGKSAVVDELARRAGALDGVRVLRCGADELGGRRPFGLVTDCFGGELMVDTGGGAGPLAELAADRAETEFWVSERAIELVSELCRDGRVCIVVDDLHWADPSSVYVLRRLLRHIGPLPIVVAATLRPAPRGVELAGLVADAGPDAVLALGPIAPAAVEELVTTAVGAMPGPRLMEQVAMANGNPLFVLELLDCARADGAIRVREVAEVESSSPPPSVLATVLRRLGYLEPETRRLLGLGAVLGRRFRAAHLAELAGADELLAGLEEALAAGLLVDDGELLSFRHELVREALYSDLAPAVRATLHREAARVLAAAGSPVGVLAEHVSRGAAPGDEEAATWLAEAARELAPSAPSVALHLFDQALALLRPGSPVAAAATADRAVALLWTGAADEGEAACRAALAVTPDPARRVPLRQCLVESLMARGKAPEVLAEVEAGVADPATDPSAEARLEGVAALARVFVGDPVGAHDLAERIGATAEATGDVPLAVQSFAVRALLAEAGGRAADASALARRGSALADADGSRAALRPWPHMAEATALVDCDRFEEAAGVVGRCRRAQEDLGARDALPILHAILGFATFWSGDWDAASVELEAATTLADETGGGWGAAWWGLGAAMALVRGRADADAWLDRADAELAAGRAGYRLEWLHWALALRGELAGAPFDPDPWRSLVAHPSPALASVGPTVVRLAVGAGATDVGRAVAAGLDHLTSVNPGVAGFAAAADAARGLLERDPLLLVRAVDGYRAAGRAVELPLAAEDAAAATTGPDAERLLVVALDGYASLGATALADRARRRLGASGVTVAGHDRPRAPSRGWDSLTPAEHRVLRLLAERRSNPEIAVALVISRRTVETHVSHILAKVGLRSRIELAEAAERQFGWRLRLEEAPERR